MIFSVISSSDKLIILTNSYFSVLHHFRQHLAHLPLLLSLLQRLHRLPNLWDLGFFNITSGQEAVDQRERTCILIVLLEQFHGHYEDLLVEHLIFPALLSKKFTSVVDDCLQIFWSLFSMNYSYLFQLFYFRVETHPLSQGLCLFFPRHPLIRILLTSRRIRGCRPRPRPRTRLKNQEDSVPSSSFYSFVLVTIGDHCPISFIRQKMSVYSSSSTTVIQKSSAEIIEIYTADLMTGRNPAKALERLYTVGTSMRPFEDAGTEELLEQYENDWTCRRPLLMLREKFASLRRHEARKVQQSIFDKQAMMEKQQVKQSMTQEKANDLFCTAVKKVSTTKTDVKRVGYSKFKIVKKSKKTSTKPLLDTPKKKDRSVKSRLRTFSFTSAVYSWSSGSSDTSPEYKWYLILFCNLTSPIKLSNNFLMAQW